MKKLSILLLLIVSSGVAADSPAFYLGGGVAQVDAGDSFYGEKFTALEVIGGYRHNDLLGLELRIGRGISDEDITLQYGDFNQDEPIVLQETGSLSLDRYNSVFYRPQFGENRFNVYGLLGYSQIKLSLSGSNIHDSVSDSGLAYGAGAGWAVLPKLNINFEFRRFDDDPEHDVIAANAVYSF